ncbi:MAG: DUF1080 domain-containing protein [Acidobacteria bacterium]|nr:DUF1080 domain-containing protein [Acidobacteriota bacterium]
MKPYFVRTAMAVTVAFAGLAVSPLLHQVEAQAKKGKKKVDRFNTPTGYTDTPVLPGQPWKVHDDTRPRPAVVTPGTQPTAAQAGRAPSDAIILFDGKDMSKWEAYGGEAGSRAPGWKLENGYMEVTTGSGSLRTKEKFGDVQLHVEWAAPVVIAGNSQWRGNSGILLMDRYEIQVLDSWDNKTYADGQAASIYGQWPPFVNASLKPGEWQAYDIVFVAPRFANGQLVKPARATVFHNGVLMHHDQEIIGPMAHRVVRKYEAHEAEEPLGLQNHDTKVRFRSIWVRRLKGYDAQ